MAAKSPEEFTIGGPLGIGSGGPLSPPSPWTPMSGYWVTYPGAVTIGNPTGGQQGNGSLNVLSLFINGQPVTLQNYLPLTGGTMTGTLTLNGAPVNNNDAATKQYVDNAVAGIGGGTFITDAPNDGHNYVRKSQTWNNLDPTLALLAPLANPAFTGVPTAPTPANVTDSSNKVATTSFLQQVILAMNPVFFDGGQCSNNSSSPLTTVNIASYNCADSTGTVWLKGAAINKMISAAWAVGTNQGGMAPGVALAANTWYHLFGAMISGVMDAFYDTDIAAGHKPPGTTAFRRVFSVRTDSNSHVVPFVHLVNQNEVVWTGQYGLSANGNSYGPGSINSYLINSWIPPGIVTRARLYGTLNIASASSDQWTAVLILPNYMTSAGASSALASCIVYNPSNLSAYDIWVVSDTGQRYWWGWYSTCTSTSFYCYCSGYIDVR